MVEMIDPNHTSIKLRATTPQIGITIHNLPQSLSGRISSTNHDFIFFRNFQGQELVMIWAGVSRAYGRKLEKVPVTLHMRSLLWIYLF
jgi:hypothetical protein